MGMVPSGFKWAQKTQHTALTGLGYTNKLPEPLGFDFKESSVKFYELILDGRIKAPTAPSPNKAIFNKWFW